MHPPHSFFYFSFRQSFLSIYLFIFFINNSCQEPNSKSEDWIIRSHPWFWNFQYLQEMLVFTWFLQYSSTFELFYRNRGILHNLYVKDQSSPVIFYLNFFLFFHFIFSCIIQRLPLNDTFIWTQLIQKICQRGTKNKDIWEFSKQLNLNLNNHFPLK